MSANELDEINGIKPLTVLKDGEEVDAKSMTSSSVYKVKRTWDHYYCTCPAWRNQGGVPINARSCKHLRAILGDKYEDARIKLKNPHGAPTKTSTKSQRGRPKGKPTSKSNPGAKRKRDQDEDDDEDADNGDKPAKKARKAASKDGDGDNGNDSEEEEEEDEDDTPPVKKVPELLLANKWDLATGPDPTGWWISEKLDGVRTFYDGKRMISRLGNPFTPPQWLLDKLPKDVTLDGELFGGRGEFQSTVSIVKTLNSPHWENITFQVFDIPSMGDKPFEDRIAYLKKTFGKGGSHASMHRIKVVEQELVRDRQHVLDRLKEVEEEGGEGLMLREPGSTYQGNRSNTLLKVKTFYDAEAVVVGYEPGKGKYKGMTGALKCEMESGKKFSVGSGMSDAQRRKPPRIGTVIVYRFQELTRDSVPRFPVFVGESADKTEAKDADVPSARKTTAKS